MYAIPVVLVVYARLYVNLACLLLIDGWMGTVE